MKHYIVILFCIIITHINAKNIDPEYNKSDANIFGHVVDKKTNEHIPYINIVIKGTTIGTTTDASGHYLLKNLPEGEFTLEVKALGYKAVSKEVALKKGKTMEVNFEIEEDHIALDGVVVSANRSETSRRTAPSLVNILDGKAFTVTNSPTLAQGLNFQPGLRVENNCQNCGFTQVRINGLDGAYSQILIDSRPVFSALSGVYGLEQVPANMIERVEVMRGGGSALFGSSAIAGTINIITKEPLRNSGEINHTIQSIGGSSSIDNNTSVNASLVTDNRKLGLYLYGQNRNRDGYDHDGDGFTEVPKLKAQTIGLRSYLKTGTYSKLSFEYHHMEEFRRGGDLLDRPAHEAFIAEQLEHSIDGGGIKFDLFSSNYKHRFNIYTSIQNVVRDSYYGVGQDPNAYGYTTGLTWISGSQYAVSFDRMLFLPADLTAGVEYNYDRLKDQMTGYNRYTDQKVEIGSAYLQNEWKNNQWSFLLGTRMDKHSLINHAVFSPRLNIRYNPVEDINVRASYSEGFRAPQAFDEDLHIESVGSGLMSTVRNAEGLKEERSRSISTSIDYYHRFGNGIQVNLLVEGFYTNLKNVFVLEEVGLDSNGLLIKERQNGSGARVKGMVFEVRSVLNAWLQMQGGITWQQSHYKKPEQWSTDPTVKAEKQMFRTPNSYGYLTSTITPIKHFSASISGTYTGSMLVQHHIGSGVNKDVAVNTPDFVDVNLKLSYEFPLYDEVKLELSGGIQNLFNAYQKDFDKGKDRDSGYIYGPSLPRSYFGGIKLLF